MRKTFLTFCAAALALLAVSSCGKLEDGLNNLKGEVSDLKDRVEKLEKKLNDEVQALQTTMATLATKEEMNTALNALKTALENKDAEFANAIQGLVSNDSDLADQLEELTALFGETAEGLKEEVLAQLAEAVASVTVKVIENEDGDVVITLANGQSFTVAKPDANANNTGLVTVNEDGEWCVVLEDGTLKSLDAKVGVEELEFSVSSDNELLYSVNGGEPVGTGAYVSDWDGTVVTDFYEDEDFVYITIGGDEYTLVKATVSTTEFNLLAGKTYFTAEQTKEIKFEVKDVKSAFLASAPKGWDAELDFAKKTLTVTAPADGEGAAEGNVEVWLLGYDGVVKTAVLPVVCGPAVVEITVDPKTNVVNILFNKMLIADYGETEEEAQMRTPEVYYGATLASEFSAKKESILENLAQLVYDETSGVHTNCDAGSPDNFALRATSYEGTVAELAYNADFNAEYVVWAIIPEWTEDWEVGNPNDFVVVYHQMNAANFEAVADVVDVDLSIEFLDPNVEGVYGFIIPDEETLRWFELGYYPLEYVLSGMMAPDMNSTMYEGNNVDVKLSELGWPKEWLDEGASNMIAPLTETFACFVPVYEGKELSDYTFDDVIVKKVATKQDLEFGSDVVVSYEIEQDYRTFDITVTAPEDLLFAMYEIYELGEAPVTDEEVLEALIDFNSFDEITYNEYEGKLQISKNSSFKEVPGREFEVVLFMVGADGKMKVERINASTKALPMNEDLKLTVDAYVDEIDNVPAAKFTVTGEGAVKMYYTANMANPTDFMTDLDAYLIDLANENSDWTEVDLTQVTMENGAFVLTGFTVVEDAISKRTNYVHAILVDADGKLAGVFSSNKLDIPAGGLKPAYKFAVGDALYIGGAGAEDGQKFTFVDASYYDTTLSTYGDNFAMDMPYYEIHTKLTAGSNYYFYGLDGTNKVYVSANNFTTVADDASASTTVAEDGLYRIRINTATGEVVAKKISRMYFLHLWMKYQIDFDYVAKGVWSKNFKLEVDYPADHAEKPNEWCDDRYKFVVEFADGNIQHYGANHNDDNRHNNPETAPEGYFDIQMTATSEWDGKFKITGEYHRKYATVTVYLNEDKGHYTHEFSNKSDSQQ